MSEFFNHTSPAHSQLVVGLAVNAALATKPEPSVRERPKKSPLYKVYMGLIIKGTIPRYHHFPYDYRVGIISMDSMHSQRFESYRFVQTSNCLWTSNDFYALQVLSMDFIGFLRVSIFCGLQVISLHFYGLLFWTLMDFHGFLSTSNDLMSMDFEKSP